MKFESEIPQEIYIIIITELSKTQNVLIQLFTNAFEKQDDDECIVRQTSTQFNYGYEYLVNSPRLVITPSTDRCYITLTLSLHFHLNGNPASPAETIKTKTTKDLAKALACKYVVSNCSDQIDCRKQWTYSSLDLSKRRTELHENMYALFRPVALMIPDYAQIAEIMLLSKSIQADKDLTYKMIRLQKLSSEQLSQQDHYNFGI
ncbi:MAG: putative Dynein heavy chain family protein [Streblomastix strix]|uniref:Putative Dynein heavy chain family protein n=1 Tax=Streblomastix strix TaxID=222440 RepID=A0A5J4VVV1_9EUKA|nr:MAG: putative Dynein heavy chain family protein [Streblomastix strix]